MQLFCPACQASFGGDARCPRCGGLLLLPHEVSPDAPHRQVNAPAPLRPTAVGRIVVGTILSLGLYLAFRKLATGFVMVTEPDPAEWWLSLKGLAAIHGSQVLAVLFGSVMAATGRASGYPLGFAVGLLCGGLFLGYELLAGAPPEDLVLYLQPPVLALLGLIGGVIGSRVWGAAPKLDMPVPSLNKLSSIRLTEESLLDPGRPTVVVRVLCGALVIVMGMALANEFRNAMQKYSGGALKVRSIGQGEFITFQLGMFATLLGGAIAGAGTGAGIRHGILAGLIGGIGVFALSAKMGTALPPVQWWLSRMSLDELPLISPAVICAVAGGVTLIGLIGGWLGGALFMPLAPAHMRQRLRNGLD